MDLELSDEQRWLAESVDELLARNAGARAWPALVEFGVLSIASGGDGLGAVELALIGRALGLRLESTPFIDTVATRYSSRLLATSDRPAFAELHDRRDSVSLALLEPGGGWELRPLATTARYRDRGRSIIAGRKVAIHHPDAADSLLVLYRSGEDRRLALIAADADGVELTPTPGIDPSVPLGSAGLAGVEVRDEWALAPDLSEAVLIRLQAIGAVLAAGEAVGAAERVVQLAVDYASQRRQFGRSIGSFQALRHLLADMHVKQASAWSSVLYAAAAIEDGIEGAARTAQIAKAYASRATVEAAHGAVQVFGGIAFTVEHPAHRFLRRILMRAAQFGDAQHHERAIGRELAAVQQHYEVVA